MTKRKTAKNVESTGRKRRKLSERQLKNLENARNSRELTLKKELEREVNELGEPVPKPVAQLRRYFKHTVDYCLSRLNAVYGTDSYPSLPYFVCHHHLTLGSSEIGRLLTFSATVERTHNRVYNSDKNESHPHQIGAHWEAKVGAFEWLECHKRRYKVLEVISQPTKLSYRYPWMIAKPDFVFVLQYKKEEPFSAIVEVKSTSYLPTYNNTPNEYIVQVQACMEAFNLSRGFLVKCLVDNEEDTYEFTVEEVQLNQNFENPSTVQKAYAAYIRKHIEQTLNVEVSDDQCYNYLSELFRNVERPPYTRDNHQIAKRKSCQWGIGESNSKSLIKKSIAPVNDLMVNRKVWAYKTGRVAYEKFEQDARPPGLKRKQWIDRQ